LAARKQQSELWKLHSEPLQVHRPAFIIYGEQFFKNMEEVKKVIHAQALMGRPIGVSARKTMGFDCIKLIYG
jgi:hypothetical protein